MKNHSRINKRPLTTSLAMLAAAGVFCTTSALAADVTVLSDNFSRDPAGTPVGTPPSKDASAGAQATAAASWVSSWGANNNTAGGYVTQTYTPYQGLDGASVMRNFKVDGANGISGNWLNNGSVANPLKFAGSATTTTEPIGLPGFAWTQINHNFATDGTVASASKLRVSFDLYRTPAGNISWFFGQGDSTGILNGNAGSPATAIQNDISLFWRGNATTSPSYGLRDSGLTPAAVPGIANYDTISYNGSPVLTTIPLAIQIEITPLTGTLGASGTSLIEMSVAGVLQDLNGSALGNGYTFAWDGEASAYMGFGSNNNPTEGTAGAPIYRASGIDNLVITAVGVPEPTSAALLGLGALAIFARSRKQA